MEQDPAPHLQAHCRRQLPVHTTGSPNTRGGYWRNSWKTHEDSGEYTRIEGNTSECTPENAHVAASTTANNLNVCRTPGDYSGPNCLCGGKPRQGGRPVELLERLTQQKCGTLGRACAVLVERIPSLPTVLQCRFHSEHLDARAKKQAKSSKIIRIMFNGVCSMPKSLWVYLAKQLCCSDRERRNFRLESIADSNETDWLTLERPVW